MSTKFYTLLTDIGAAKLASAAALGVPLKITHMAVGDGGGVLPTPDAKQTALVNEKRRAALNMLYIDPQNSSQIIAEQVIPENEGGWWIREVGLFDESGALIAVGNCPESYKPQLAEGSGRTQTVRMVLITSSTENITLKIDPAVVLATRKYVDDKVLELKVYVDDLMAKHLAAQDPHSQYAQKESPTFTGKPKAPTPAAGNNTTQIATTAFVQAALMALINGAPATLDTLKEIAAAINNDPKFSTTINNALALKAPLSSPALTGTPTAPTAAQSVNNTQIATTAFVKSAIAAMVGSAPAALDTLNELAAALGNDPNFATTMLNALAGKQPLDNTLTNLSGKDVAGLLAYLGLGDSNGYVGRKIAEQWITSSKTVTLNPLTKRIKVTLTGGGGGGGGAFNSGAPTDNFSGAGGAAGATGIKWFNVADITDWSLVIGSGGTEATKGGDSTFSGIVAPGGAPSVASTVFASGGTGVAGTGADVNMPGGDGGDGQNGAYLLSGFGGASYWGGVRRAGQGQTGSTTIPQAVIPGGGGGGAFDTQKLSTRFYGGQGGNGCCLIEEYA
ncbi:phage tail protein [Escherichia coli]|nr:phage tail protein [Shigella sonnei]EHP8055588.1 phage tail protein [Escherichia coli]EIM5965357.1 phage tail protein [Escherichia coli]EJZ1802431.1 phage tail protein [Escherichia coli]EKK1028042.1 phage tail protein [Escherichia coli]